MTGDIDRPRVGEGHPRGAAPARRVLPLRRLPAVRRPTATSSSPSATTRPRARRTASRRSTSGPAARRSTPSAPRPTRTTCAASCCASSRPPEGGYTIPAGNLFAPGQMGTKPEIYAMGLRNPFRFSVDQKTGWVYLADYGPDANAADPGRGSDGRVEWNLIKRPATMAGRTATAARPFNDYDFATGQSGADVQLRAPGQQLAQQHGPHEPPAGGRADALVRPRRRASRARSRRRADGRPALRVRPGGPVRPPVAGVLRGLRALLRVGPEPALPVPSRRAGRAVRHDAAADVDAVRPPARDEVRPPRRRAVHDRVGQRLQRQQPRRAGRPDRLRRRPGEPGGQGHGDAAVGLAAADREVLERRHLAPAGRPDHLQVDVR